MKTRTEHGKKMGLVWLLVIFIVAGLSAGILPLLAKKIPWNWELKISDLISPNFKDCKPKNRDSQKALDKLVERLYPISNDDSKFTITIHVIKQNEINAFASLGGNIYINSKLIEVVKTPEELASVIAHEIGHVQNRHIIQAMFSEVFVLVLKHMSGLGTDSDILIRNAMNLKFSRTQEEQADEAGLERLKLAKVSAQGMVDFFNRLEDLGSGGWELMSDHPSSKSRADFIKSHLGGEGKPILTDAEWTSLKKYTQTVQ